MDQHILVIANVVHVGCRSLIKTLKLFQVAQQCKENIYAIQTLKDFQYLDENKDQGINVREKAKAVVALLKDDDRLKNERVRALKAKERFAQAAAGIGSDTVVRKINAHIFREKIGLRG